MDGNAKSATISANVGSNPTLKSTFDDEYVYDTAGNVVKHKQTEYFNFDSKEPSFVVWETEFKVVNGSPLPFRQSVNGVVYVEIEYDVLASQNKGKVTQGTSNRRFVVQQQLGFDKVFFSWYPNLDHFPVGFKDDGKFVVAQRTFNNYSGWNDENVLTLGFDNVVLKHYLYSYSKMVEGFNKSFQWNLFNSRGDVRTDDTEFTY
jgi:hypothetical protein